MTDEDDVFSEALVEDEIEEDATSEDEEITPEDETTEEIASEDETVSSPLKIETLSDIRRLFVTLEGGDPDAQQTINDFIKFRNNIERSNLPNIETALAMTQLTAYGRLFFPHTKDNPFNHVADDLAIALMARGGWKSNGFVELMKQTPNLKDLQTIGQPPKQSVVDRLLGRTREDEE